MAVMTHVLPDAETRATMLGVANIAGTLPQLIAPVLAAPIVTGLGHVPVFRGSRLGVTELDWWQSTKVGPVTVHFPLPRAGV